MKPSDVQDAPSEIFRQFPPRCLPYTSVDGNMFSFLMNTGRVEYACSLKAKPTTKS